MPKILSFEEEFVGLDKFSVKHFLLPCLAYKISLPIKKERNLNTLEQVVLELINCGITDELKLNQLCGFDFSQEKPGEVAKRTELTGFILTKLQHAGYIDDRNKILNLGKTTITNWHEDNAAPKTVPVTIYYDLLNQQFLPIVNNQRHQYRHVENPQKEGVIVFNRGSVGETKTIRSNIIAYKDLKAQKVTLRPEHPNVLQVKIVINRFIKRQNLTSALSSKFINRDVYLPQDQAITIEEQPEALYIHIQATKQVGNNSVIVSDGFGLGYSNNNKNLLEKHEEKTLVNLKKSSQERKPYVLDKDFYKLEHDIEINVEPSWDLYPALKNQIINIEKNYALCSESSINSNQEKENLDRFSHIFSALYSAIEHTLAATYRKYHVDWKLHYINSRAKENGDVALNYANRLGFNVSKLATHLFIVSKGRLAHSDLDKPDLQTFIALNMASATEYKNHPVLSLATKMPDLFNKMSALKLKRNAVNHGDHDNKELKMATLNDVIDCREWVYQMISDLLPNVKLPDCNQKLQNYMKAYSSEMDQMSLQVSINLDDFYGLAIQNLMSVSLKIELERAEKQLIHSEHIEDYDYDYSVFINNLSSSLQNTISQVKQSFPFVDVKNVQLIEVANENAKAAGFLLIDDQLPKTISSVNENKVRDACNNIESTLGAEIQALLICAEEVDLQKIQCVTSSLLIDIGKLLDYRKHGNSKITASYLEMTQLKQSIFSIIKIIMETYSE